ncbi:ATP-binding protein [Paremcibacter congregatus]|uniref:histidine kinase n=1 Tax=Paremcibacter congregatus TaxID=2043170 RepID=A0A2G4YU67_9PROT|nr:ATP-binding protein [Paremcibacter congregatus]PHZ85875.1 hypothetical protein CRD36_04135 [Paremcibacter congregatus]QDE26839.1 response regulator [Paremcibacter congregatus]
MLNLSLNSRLHILIGMLVTSITAIAAITTLQYVQNDKLAELELRAQRTVDLQANALVRPRWELDKAAERALLNALKTDEDLLYAALETGDANHSIAVGEKPAPSSDVINVSRKIVHTVGEKEIPLGTLSLVFSKASLNEFRTTMIISGIIATIAFVSITLGGIFIALRLFARPLKELTESIMQLANGDHTVNVPSLERDDEIGKVAAAVQTFKKYAIDNINLQKEALGERTQKEEEARRAMVAHQASKEKSRFLSNMSHELRTPLNAILGFSQLLESSKREKLSDRQRKHLGHITKGGNHLLNLINDILDLSKIEAGKMVMSLETINSRSLINDCLTFAKPIAHKKKIKIQDRSPTNLPALHADHLRAKQVILNLFSNAIKYNHENGLIWVETERVKDNMLRISISDSGYGIPKNKQVDLFQPFQRLGAETTDIEGSGIGLVLTKRMVEGMGGAIGFESTENKGSTFWIDLPLATIDEDKDEPSPIDAEETENALPDQSHLMLYVEDNPSNLALMEGIVDEIPNLTLVSAHSAELGLVLAEELKPDIIILDINLPGMDGFEAVKRLRQAEGTKKLPVIALSANAMPQDIRRGENSDFNDYLTKPINLPKLIHTLQAALGDQAQMETP